MMELESSSPSTWKREIWLLWIPSALVFAVQMVCVTIKRQQPTYTLRFLEKGADEDDKLSHDDAMIYDNDDLEWFELGKWIDPTSLLYDIIEGFLYAADAFFIAWVLWGCLVHCGILPDDRLDRRRRIRRLKDGRGVFAPIRNFDPLDSSDDEGSRDSMEYGDSHEEDEYGDVNLERQEREIALAAQKFFERAEKKRREKMSKKKTTPGKMEGAVLLLDLEMSDKKPEKVKNSPGADVVFL